MVKEILKHGYRVIWKGQAAGYPNRGTVWFKTEEEAERSAQALRDGGDIVVRIEHKKGE